jgi:hypothetical protein
MNWLGGLNARCSNLDGTQVTCVGVLDIVLGFRRELTGG